MTSMPFFSIIFVNCSQRIDDFCVFQQDPNLRRIRGLSTVAWLVKRAAHTTCFRLQWEPIFNFAWSESGKLTPGAPVQAGQVWRTDPIEHGSQVNFNHTQGVFTFENQRPGPESNQLFIHQSSTIPRHRVSVGIGMADSPTFVVQAEPGRALKFPVSLPPQYWISFDSYSRGEVLNTDIIFDKEQVSFPTNVYSMTAILDETNSWTVTPTEQVKSLWLAKLGVDLVSWRRAISRVTL